MLNVLRVKNKAIKTAHSDDNGIVLVFIEHINLILFPFLLFFFCLQRTGTSMFSNYN